MTRTSLLFLIFLLAMLISKVVVEEEVLRGAIYEITYEFPRMTSLMWRFRDESYWEKGFLFHVVVPKSDDYKITVSLEIYDSNNNLIHSDKAITTESLSANTKTLLYIVFRNEIPIKPLEFLQGAYYFVVEVDIAKATSNRALGTIISWVPKPLVSKESLVLPSSYTFKVSYKDVSATSDFQCNEITYGIVLESKDYSKIDYVYATAIATNTNGVKIQGTFSANGNAYSISSWDGSYAYFYPNNLKLHSNMNFELDIILRDP